MTGHQINSLVGDLVAMAQAMERLPQVEAELHAKGNEVVDWQRRYDIIAQDLEQSRAYAASLEAKVHSAEVARDDAELRFLESDDKLAKLAKVFQVALEAVDTVDRTLTDLTAKPQPEPQHEPMPVAIEPSGYEHDPVPSLEGTPMPQPLQGQSEPDPISHSSPVDDAPSQSPVVTSDHTAIGSSPPSGPYSGRRYIDYPGYVMREDWLAGGGTEENYDWREGDPTPAIRRYSGSF